MMSIDSASLFEKPQAQTNLSAATTSDGGENETVKDQVLVKKNTIISVQKNIKAVHDLDCTCSHCVSSMAKEIQAALAVTRKSEA